MQLGTLPAAVRGCLVGFPDEFVVLEGQVLRFGLGVTEVIYELSPLAEQQTQPRAAETGHVPPFRLLRTRSRYGSLPNRDEIRSGGNRR